mmetsp:Transcript_3472/g.15857  ORF Transcript_3472/g.15857 Transcript_3472/m.15857 type:complete len:214 (+) Transcript_3472:738-1379(+)
MFRLCRTKSSLLHGLSKKFPSQFSFHARDLPRRSSSSALGSHTVTPGNATSCSTALFSAACPSTNRKKCSTPSSAWYLIQSRIFPGESAVVVLIMTFSVSCSDPVCVGRVTSDIFEVEPRVPPRIGEPDETSSPPAPPPALRGCPWDGFWLTSRSSRGTHRSVHSRVSLSVCVLAKLRSRACVPRIITQRAATPTPRQRNTVRRLALSLRAPM